MAAVALFVGLSLVAGAIVLLARAAQHQRALLREGAQAAGTVTVVDWLGPRHPDSYEYTISYRTRLGMVSSEIRSTDGAIYALGQRVRVYYDPGDPYGFRTDALTGGRYSRLAGKFMLSAGAIIALLAALSLAKTVRLRRVLEGAPWRAWTVVDTEPRPTRTRRQPMLLTLRCAQGQRTLTVETKEAFAIESEQAVWVAHDGTRAVLAHQRLYDLMPAKVRSRGSETPPTGGRTIPRVRQRMSKSGRIPPISRQ